MLCARQWQITPMNLTHSSKLFIILIRADRVKKIKIAISTSRLLTISEQLLKSWLDHFPFAKLAKAWGTTSKQTKVEIHPLLRNLDFLRYKNEKKTFYHVLCFCMCSEVCICIFTWNVCQYVNILCVFLCPEICLHRYLPMKFLSICHVFVNMLCVFMCLKICIHRYLPVKSLFEWLSPVPLVVIGTRSSCRHRPKAGRSEWLYFSSKFWKCRKWQDIDT